MGPGIIAPEKEITTALKRTGSMRASLNQKRHFNITIIYNPLPYVYGAWLESANSINYTSKEVLVELKRCH
jgi:hypothetical protein